MLAAGGDDGRRSAGAAPGDPAPVWRRDGLEAQPRLSVLRDRTLRDVGYEPGTTPWRPARLPDEGDGVDALRAATPGALLARVLDRIGWNDDLGTEAWEQTLRVWRGEEGDAVGVALRWGLQDDAIAGHDVRVRMRETTGGWAVAGIEERFHCARGITADRFCL